MHEPEVIETTLRECSRCKQSLQILHTKEDGGERVVALEVRSGKRHVCWDLPDDVNLLVLDD